MNKNLNKVSELIGIQNIDRILEVLTILGKQLPSDFDYEISYKEKDGKDEDWHHVNDWPKYLYPEVNYYINISEAPNTLNFQYPREYIKFIKKADGTGDIEIVTTDNDYVYSWHKGLKNGSESFEISKSKIDNCTFSFEEIQEGMETSTISFKGTNTSFIKIVRSDVIEVEGSFGKRPVEEYYQVFTEGIDRMYNGYLPKVLPSIMNSKNINIIKAMFKTPINNLVGSLDYNERMRRYNATELDLYTSRKDNLADALKEYTFYRKNYEAKVDIINKEYKEKVKRLKKYLPVKEETKN